MTKVYYVVVASLCGRMTLLRRSSRQPWAFKGNENDDDDGKRRGGMERDGWEKCCEGAGRGPGNVENGEKSLRRSERLSQSHLRPAVGRSTVCMQGQHFASSLTGWLVEGLHQCMSIFV